MAEIGERLPFPSDAYFRRQCRNSLPIGCWAKRRHHHSFSFAADVQKRLDLQGVNGRQMQRLRRFVSPWLVLPMPIERTLLHSLLRLILLIDLSTPPSTHKVRQVSTFFAKQTINPSSYYFFYYRHSIPFFNEFKRKIWTSHVTVEEVSKRPHLPNEALRTFILLTASISLLSASFRAGSSSRNATVAVASQVAASCESRRHDSSATLSPHWPCRHTAFPPRPPADHPLYSLG